MGLTADTTHLHPRRVPPPPTAGSYGPLGDLEWTDTRLRRRETVIGMATGGHSRAFPLRRVRSSGPVNDVVGEIPVVVTVAGRETLLAHDRRIGGNTVTFRAGDDGTLLAGGSRFRRLSGEAVDGPYKRATLSPVPGLGPLYWAAWLSFYPDTSVYGIDG